MPPTVRLDPITADNVRPVFDLAVAPDQTRFVASNALSLAEALADYSIAWPRAIVADDEVVGFLMLEIDQEERNGRPFWLWRLMVDAAHQRRGYGRRALDLACDEVRRRGGAEFFTSWVPGDAGPAGFYLTYGFVPTGEIDDDEIVARLML